jgi:hypothetical protein
MRGQIMARNLSREPTGVRRRNGMVPTYCIISITPRGESLDPDPNGAFQTRHLTLYVGKPSYLHTDMAGMHF